MSECKQNARCPWNMCTAFLPWRTNNEVSVVDVDVDVGVGVGVGMGMGVCIEIDVDVDADVDVDIDMVISLFDKNGTS